MNNLDLNYRLKSCCHINGRHIVCELLIYRKTRTNFSILLALVSWCQEYVELTFEVAAIPEDKFAS
jgi:hypothetical protein